jgi:glycosyltransferase involved in cell wall biosynthesis
MLMLPDEERRWIIPGFLKGCQLIKKSNIRCILTSAPPHSVHLLGLLLRIFCRTAWIADFRDPWTHPYYPLGRATCKLSASIEQFLERTVIRNSHYTVSTTEELNKIFRELYGDLCSSRFVTIQNGFDKEKFCKLQGNQKESKFTITYTGTLYAGRSPLPVMKAVNSIINSGRIAKDDIKINLVGECEYIDGIRTSEIAASLNLESVVNIVGQVPHTTSLEIMMRSHIGLVLAPDQPFQIPAKIYEYLGAGLNILVIGGAGATKALIESQSVGAAFDGEEEEEIENFILDAICRWKSGEEIFLYDASKFDVVNLVGLLALTLSESQNKVRALRSYCSEG